ncbi:2-amino-4-hydroxy-6-hydroxymethyldihydropteridine diphosphokinase [Peteryoungia desertarenae]|nr:2-amino-4-hydroxy-6-hydroxymethyldihydropteridine diphosphokinase [Peteryoungia desertarenae]
MARALTLLDLREDCRVAEVSGLYRTPPWGMVDQAEFYNACALVETRLSPRALLSTCLEIERDMKRERIERWGPRTIDIDILTFEDILLVDEHLKIPHPRMTERAFVLKPLSDIAAGQVVHGKTVAEWLGQSDVTGITLANGNRGWWRA